MRRQQQTVSTERTGVAAVPVSRRTALASSGLAFLGVLSSPAFGREESQPAIPRQVQERMVKSREFSERMRSAGNPEEFAKIMEERNVWERTRAIDELKSQLEISEQEWSVIKPRFEAVYNRVRPQPHFGGPNAQPANPVERSMNELRQILANKDAPADQIKAKLTALRAAQLNATQELAKARQDLRQIMTLRQEAILVTNGLLD